MNAQVNTSKRDFGCHTSYLKGTNRIRVSDSRRVEV